LVSSAITSVMMRVACSVRPAASSASASCSRPGISVAVVRRRVQLEVEDVRQPLVVLGVPRQLLQRLQRRAMARVGVDRAQQRRFDLGRIGLLGAEDGGVAEVNLGDLRRLVRVGRRTFQDLARLVPALVPLVHPRQ
jgi:hypothetical protein